MSDPLTVQGNGQILGRTEVVNASSVVINPATEETVSQLVTAVTNSIKETAFDLNAAAFNETTAINDDYDFDSVELNFSTTEVKTITITSADGTILWGGDVDQTAANRGYLTTAENFYLGFNHRGFDGGDNITVEVTQFASPGTMDCVLRTKSGTNSLLGNPTVKVSDNEGNIYEDAIPSHSMPVVDIDHYFTHAGAAFQSSDTDTVVQASFKDFLIITPVNDEVHLINWHFTSTIASAEVVLYEDPITTTDGSALVLFNKKRTSAKTSDTLLYQNPTGVTIGTQIEHDLIVGGKQSGGGNFSETGEEWVLKKDSKYLIRYNNNGNQDDVMDWKITTLEPAKL